MSDVATSTATSIFRQLSIDLRRVRSTGYSAGAVFSADLMEYRSA